MGVTVTKGTASRGSLIIEPATSHITNPGFSYDASGEPAASQEAAKKAAEQIAPRA